MIYVDARDFHYKGISMEKTWVFTFYVAKTNLKDRFLKPLKAAVATPNL